MKKHDLKLTIELVPSSAWYKNLRNAMPQSEWDDLRRAVYRAYEYRCAICGGAGRMNCHEVWVYDDERHVQTLSRFVALCDNCHHIKHIGLAGILADEGELDYEALIAHFCKVNNCDRAIFDQHREAAFEQWEERSQHDWTIDLGIHAWLFEGGKQ